MHSVFLTKSFQFKFKSLIIPVIGNQKSSKKEFSNIQSDNFVL